MLAACASTQKDETLGWSAERLYSEAKEDMAVGNWAGAIATLQKLESRYPFGSYAQQAMLETAYSQWKAGDLAPALATIDRFERLYPSHPRLDYAYFLRGLINFNDQESLFAVITGEELAERDPQAAKEAFVNFKAVVERFPQSPYANDAQSRLTYLVNTLADNEVVVARYYLRRGAFLAGVNRAKSVVETYAQTPAVEEALAQMRYGYQQMGLTDLANDSERVLALNFAGSPYLKKPYDPKIRGGVPERSKLERPGFFTKLGDKLLNIF